jgi:lipid-A-disaccharide synthase-like uncharacterized protein
MDDWRSFLYPLGFVASILFFLRFYIQWFKSEKKRESHVTPIFWRLSFFANMIMVIHGVIQFQYPLSLIQKRHSIHDSWALDD